jgi:CheY-like chemotaxis protein
VAKILIIEDNTLESALYQKTFTSSGYEVTQAAEGEDGLAQAKSFRPDLILLDVRMPGIDGVEVMKRLKADPTTSSIPVVILTNLAGNPEVQAALDLGALRFIVKSENKPARVEQVVREILESPISEAVSGKI